LLLLIFLRLVAEVCRSDHCFVRPFFFCSFLLAPVLSQRLERGPIFVSAISAFSAPSLVWVQWLGQIRRHMIQHPKIAARSWFLRPLIIPCSFFSCSVHCFRVALVSCPHSSSSFHLFLARCFLVSVLVSCCSQISSFANPILNNKLEARLFLRRLFQSAILPPQDDFLVE
jgi:hypothetical protein